jgi:2,3-bisphosphoglycerate-dependent phosphoglycerate mutase
MSIFVIYTALRSSLGSLSNPSSPAGRSASSLAPFFALHLIIAIQNPQLTALGREEALKGAKELKKRDYKFDIAFTSDLVRAQETLNIILKELGQEDIPIVKNQALNERDYGELTGLNKDDARKKWGEEQVHIWRRSYVSDENIR